MEKAQHQLIYLSGKIQPFLIHSLEFPHSFLLCKSFKVLYIQRFKIVADVYKACLLLCTTRHGNNQHEIWLHTLTEKNILIIC